MAISSNKYYYFKSVSDNKYLNIYTNGSLSNGINVKTYPKIDGDECQIWYTQPYSSTLNTFLLKSKKNLGYALDRWRGSSNYNNADIYSVGTTEEDLADQLIQFVNVGNNNYRIKLKNYNLYLTVNTSTSSSDGSRNIYWTALNSGSNSQLWRPEEYEEDDYSGVLARNTNCPTETATEPFIINNIPDYQFSSHIENGVEFHPSCGLSNNSDFNLSSDGSKIKNVLKIFSRKVFGINVDLDDDRLCYYLYGERRNNGGNNQFHTGVDISYLDGHPIKALYPGVVKYSGGTFGTVTIQTSEIGVCCNYLHMRDITVTNNQHINAGDTIGYQSNVSDESIGSHLHFEVVPYNVSGPQSLVTSPNVQMHTIMPYGYMDGEY